MESTTNPAKKQSEATDTNKSSTTQQRTPLPTYPSSTAAVKPQQTANMKQSSPVILTEAQLQAKRERREAKLKRRLEKEKKRQLLTSPPPAPQQQPQKRKKLKMPKISFPINEECTSLKLSPSGRHIIAAFTDGTLRLFDTTGRLWSPSPSKEIQSEMNHLFDSDSDDDLKGKAKQRMVASKSFQNYGAVACQIHARGVITSLLMDVDICQDGKFAFGGVLRGSTELVAVDLSLVEKYHDDYLDPEGNGQGQKMDILDLIQVYRHSDAKLKGFGACVRLKGSVPEYRLFTGKGIKNMHIWSFIPPHGDKKEPTWQCLYDTPTNGNTITYLNFRRDSNGLLQGISKSDDQKLRIWDLSYEEDQDSSKKSVIQQLAQKAEKEASKDRPKRPPYIDVLSTENALSVCGSYVFSGGDSMYNKLGVMYLDVENIQCPFNHTELALPNANGQVEAASTGRRSSRSGSGRQQRGDLKSVVKVAGMNRDAQDVLLELSDQSLMHYSQTGSQPKLNPLAFTCAEQSERKICITRLPTKKSVIALATYEENKNHGTITMKYLSEKNEGSSIGPSVRTGYTEPISNQQMVQLEKMRALKLEQQQRMADEMMRVKKAEKKMKKKMGQLSPGAMSNSSSPSASVVSMRSIGSTERVKSKKEDFVSPYLKRKNIEELSDKSKYAKISPLGGASMSPEVTTKGSYSSLIPEETPVKRSKSKSPSPAPIGKSPKINSSFQKSEAVPRTKNSVSPVSTTKPSYTTSPPSNHTSLESSAVGVAVSPEMSKTIESTSEAQQVSETSKPIAKFFEQKNDGKSSSGKHSQSKKKINRKVKFIHQSPLKVRSPTQTEEEASTLRPLNEGDIASALEKLKKIASDPTLTNSGDYPSVAKRDNVDMLDYISTCHMRKRPKLTQKSSLPIYKKSNTIFTFASIPLDLDRQQFEARRTLALNHRSEHERLRNAVVQSGERIMNALNCEETKCTTKSHWIEYVNKSLNEALTSHQNALADMLQRQQMESKSLAQTQMLETGTYVPQMSVSFPFPDIFQQVETSTKSFLSC